MPNKARNELESDNWKLLLVQSEYATATDEVNQQISELKSILKKYDSSGMLIGEAPCTKDLIEITDRDFQVVNTISIIAIFVIIAVVLKSISLPVILVAVIEFAIFINLEFRILREPLFPLSHRFVSVRFSWELPWIMRF